MKSKTKNHPMTSLKYFTRRAGEIPAHLARAVRQVAVEAPICGFCSQRSITRCEYPECNVPVCKRCRIRKGGGNLCRRHKDARLVQQLGVPMVGDVAVYAVPSRRFKAKGPALPGVDAVVTR